MTTIQNTFNPRRLLLVALMTLLIGVGVYATAWQFNDGHITQHVLAFVCIGAGMPNLFIAGVMRLFGQQVGKVFALVGALFLVLGLGLFIFNF